MKMSSLFIFSPTCCNVPSLESQQIVMSAVAVQEKEQRKKVLETGICGLMQILLGPQIPTGTPSQLCDLTTGADM